MLCWLEGAHPPLETLIKQAERCCPQILTEHGAKNEKVMVHRLNAYLLLASLAGGTLPKLGWTESGKPFFSEGGGFCSLSHTDSGAAAAVCSCPVGIDLQTVVPLQKKLLERVCTPVEVQYCLGADSPQEQNLRFTRVWTAKEAVAKADGRGIGEIGLRNIVCDCAQGTSILPKGCTYRLLYPESRLESTVLCIAVQDGQVKNDRKGREGKE